MTEQFFIQELANGLTLLGQRMEQVASAAMTLVVPAGAAHDPPAAAGAGAVACEWCIRGAGGRQTRELNDALDALGCQHHESAQSEHLLFSATQLGRNLLEVLAIFADILRRPQLAEETFAPSRALIAQDLASLEDEPAQKIHVLLRERFYPRPLGRCAYGTAETLRALEPGTLRDHYRGAVGPRGAILAAAGNIDFPSLSERVEELFGDWQARQADPVQTQPPENGVTFLQKDSAQAHIAMAHPAAPVGHELYYPARMAAMVLSGGPASRLHTEVREKRGLVYHVSSHYHSLKDCAGMFTYAASRPDVAQQTLEVTVGELRRLADGVEGQEIARARTQLKSALIMQGESTAARANTLASDWYHLHRLRALQEVADAIEAVTPDDVLAYLSEFPARGFTATVIGPRPIDTAVLNGQ